MPSTYTLNNGIELIGTGEQSGTWGDTTNTNLGLLDTALDGQVSITLASAGNSGSPNNLPISDGAASDGRNRMITFADGGDLGATAFVQLTPNDSEKIIYVRNDLSGSRSIIMFQGTYNASNDYEIPAGTTAIIYFDGAGSGAVAANVFNNAYFDSLRLGGVSVTAILDEDDMSSDSATALSTQQSIKAYVDAQVGTADELSEVLANGNTTGGTDLAVSAGDDITFTNTSKAIFGTGSSLEIYGDGSNSYISDQGTGNLKILAENFVLKTPDDATNAIFADTDASVYLYHAGAERLATTSTGIDVAGTVTADGLTVGGVASLSEDVSTETDIITLTGTSWGDDELLSLPFKRGSNTLAKMSVAADGGGTQGVISLHTRTGGTVYERLNIASNGDISFYDSSGNASFVYDESAGSTFNEQSDAKDFQVKSNSNSHMLFVDGTNDRVYLGSNTDNVSGDFRFNGITGIYQTAAVAEPQLRFATDHDTGATEWALGNTPSSTDFSLRVFDSGWASVFSFDVSGDMYLASKLGIGKSSPAYSLDIKGSSSTTTGIRLKNSDESVGGGQVLSQIIFENSDDTGGVEGNYYIKNISSDGFAASNLDIRYDRDGTQKSRLKFTDASGSFSTVFNDDGENVDFRVESDGNANAIFMNAGNGTTAFGTTSDNYNHASNEGIYLSPGSSSSFTANSAPIRINRNGTGGNNRSNLELYNNGTIRGWIGSLGAEAGIYLHADGSGGVHIYGDEVVVNENSADLDFRVESDGNSNMLFVDAGNNAVGIGTGNTGNSTLEVRSTGVDGTFANAIGFQYSSNPDEANTISTSVSSNAGNSGFKFNVSDGGGSSGKTSVAKFVRNEIIFNDDSNDQDFRVESDSNVNMLFVDAGAGDVTFGNVKNNAAWRTTDGVRMIGYGHGTSGYMEIVRTTSSDASANVYMARNEFSNGRMFSFNTQTADVGSITVNSSGTTYNTTSDRRLKDNIEPIADATDKLMSMKPVTHTWKADPDAPAVHGFIAQEMQEIVPEAVSGDPDGEEMMAMDYGRITPVLVAALQDAHNKIEALETRLAELEGK